MDKRTIERYEQLKQQHPDAVFLMEQPESYLLANADARTVAELLDVSISLDDALVLPRSWMEETTSRLVKAGHRVAIEHLQHSSSVVAEPRARYASPFVRCDFCRRDHLPLAGRKLERRAWTLFPTCRKFACPDCRRKGEAAESRARAQRLSQLNHRNNAA